MVEDRTLPGLTKDFAFQLGDLVRDEVRLARAEIADHFKGMTASIIQIALGVALAAAGVTLALVAVAYAIAERLPMWAGALIAAAIGLVLAWILISAGKKALAQHSVSLPRTARQISNDLQALKETVAP